MRMETVIRKSLGLKAHFVMEIIEVGNTLLAIVDRLGLRLLRCSCCGRKARRTHGRACKDREWRDLSVRDKQLVIVYRPFRVVCPTCGVRVEKLPWAAPRQRVTDALAMAVAMLAKKLSWSEVASHYRLNWKTVAAVVKRAVACGLARRRWKPLHVLGIDEVSRSKGQKYITLVYDLERGQLVWIGKDRVTSTMNEFFAWLGKRRRRSITVVCCDMWAIYIDAIRTNLPKAQIVFDRFHVVKHLNEAVEEVRRAMWRALHGEERIAFKRTRWLWLKNPWNLTRKESRRLSALCRKNMPIIRAYYLKEAFQHFWDYLYEGWARPYLKHWLWWASHSKLEPFIKFGQMIRDHLDGILAWTKLRVSNGALEGLNNKVKSVSKRSYGFRNPETYMNAIWHACGNLPLVLE